MKVDIEALIGEKGIVAWMAEVAFRTETSYYDEDRVAKGDMLVYEAACRAAKRMAEVTTQALAQVWEAMGRPSKESLVFMAAQSNPYLFLREAENAYRQGDKEVGDALILLALRCRVAHIAAAKAIRMGTGMDLSQAHQRVRELARMIIPGGSP